MRYTKMLSNKVNLVIVRLLHQNGSTEISGSAQRDN